MRDTKTLHFLKEFPAWCVLLIVFIFVFIYYIQTQDGFVQRLVDAAMGALFTALVSNRAKTPTATTSLSSTDGGDVNIITGDTESKVAENQSNDEVEK